MDAYSTYHLLTTLYLTLQSLPLLLTPRLVITMLQTNVRDTTETETFLCRAFAVSLLALALLSLVLSGVVPLQSGSGSTSVSDQSGADAGGGSGYATPTTLVTVVYHISGLVLSYVRFSKTGQFPFAIGVLGSGALAAVGTWCLVFGGDAAGSGKVHSSGFMFPDKEKRQRKVERREEKWAKKGL